MSVVRNRTTRDREIRPHLARRTRNAVQKERHKRVANNQGKRSTDTAFMSMAIHAHCSPDIGDN